MVVRIIGFVRAKLLNGMDPVMFHLVFQNILLASVQAILSSTRYKDQ
jgi:hypothetical protein